jgi:hypothetical protein
MDIGEMMNKALDEKKAARFQFLPKLREIAQTGDQELKNMEEIGKDLGFDLKATERIEDILVAEGLIKYDQYFWRISLKDDDKEIAYSAKPRSVWENHNQTVLALFDHEKLKAELEKWAIKNDSNISWGDPRSPDVIAIPSFALIIDRRFMDSRSWDLYLEFSNDYDGDGVEYWQTKPCIIIDDIRDMELPRFNQVMLFDIGFDESIQWIIRAVAMAKEMLGIIKLPDLSEL